MSDDTPFHELARRWLAAGFEPDAESLADVLWLAQWLPHSPKSIGPLQDAEQTESGQESQKIDGQQSSANQKGQSDLSEKGAADSARQGSAQESDKRDSIETGHSKSSGLYAQAKPTASGHRASPVNVPASSALPGALDIARALRPFNRRQLTSHRLVLDEEASVESVAHFGFVRPVFRPLAEPWFDIALVIDGARSMEVWRKTLTELEQLLANHGAFGQIRRWRLLGEGKIRLESPSGQTVQPSALNDPRGRTLILIATNGVSAFWNSGAFADVLAAWSSTAPVGIMQLFSERQWAHTALGPASRQVRAPLPGIPSAKLIVERKRWERKPPDEKLTTLPIVSLTPESIAAWARATMAMGVDSIPAVVFVSGKAEGKDESCVEVETIPKGPKARVQNFHSIASQEAFRLACHLAAVPLTLPIMRIVQRQLFPQPRVEHLAEVLASGLIERITPADAKVDPDQVVYDFPEAIRDLLFGSLRLTVAVDIRAHVQAKLKEFIERQLGRSIENFRAFVLDEQGQYELPADAQAFVEIERGLLKRLGFVRKEADKTIPKAEVRKRVLVVGTGWQTGLLPEVYLTASAIGAALARQGYVLVCGGWPGVDYLVAEAFIKTLTSAGGEHPGRLVQMVEESRAPDYKHTAEPVRVSHDHWAEEMVAQCDAVVLIGGMGGTAMVYYAALAANSPIIPIAGSGGDAEKAFQDLANQSRGSFPDYRALQTLGGPIKSMEDAERIGYDTMEVLNIALNTDRRKRYISLAANLYAIVRSIAKTKTDALDSSTLEPECKYYLTALDNSAYSHELRTFLLPEESLKSADALSSITQISIDIIQDYLPVAEPWLLWDFAILNRLERDWPIAATVQSIILAALLQSNASGQLEKTLEGLALVRGEAFIRRLKKILEKTSVAQDKKPRINAWLELAGSKLKIQSWLELATEFLKPVDKYAFNRAFDNLRSTMKNEAASIDLQVIESLITHGTAPERVIAYTLFRIRPSISLKNPPILLTGLEREREESGKSLETRPLWLVLTNLDYVLREGKLEMEALYKIQSAFGSFLEFLASRPDIDPGRECRTYLQKLFDDLSKRLSIENTPSSNQDNSGLVLDSAIACLATTGNGGQVFCGCSDGSLRLLDVDTGRELKRLIGHSSGITSVAILPNGKRAVSASLDHTIRLWDLETGETIRLMEAHRDSIHGLAVSPDGTHLLSGSDGSRVGLWDLTSGRLLQILRGHSDTVYSVAFLPDGRRALSGSQDKTVMLWDLGRNQTIHIMTGHKGRVGAVLALPDGRRALSGSNDKTLRLWDLEKGSEIRKLTGHNGRILAAAIAPSGRWALAGSSDGTLYQWDLDSGELVDKRQGHNGHVVAVAVLPDGMTAVSGSTDGQLRVWRNLIQSKPSSTQDQAWQTLFDLARHYEGIRQAEPSNPKRTVRLEKIVRQVIDLHSSLNISENQIRKLFDTAKPGDRLVALVIIFAAHETSCVDLAVQAVSQSLSRFEQYHALKAIALMIEALSPEQRNEVAQVIRQLPPHSGHGMLGTAILLNLEKIWGGLE